LSQRTDRRDRPASAREEAKGLPLSVRRTSGRPSHRESLLDRARRFARNHRAAILLVLAYALMRVLLILILGR